MDAKQLVLALLRADGPSRDLDREIAIFAGYKSRSGSKPGEEYWTSPSQVDFLALPKFTESLDAAFELMMQTASSDDGGLSWEPQAGSARLSGDRYMQAALPSLALCASVTFRLALSRFAETELNVSRGT